MVARSLQLLLCSGGARSFWTHRLWRLTHACWFGLLHAAHSPSPEFAIGSKKSKFFLATDVDWLRMGLFAQVAVDLF